MQHCDEDRPCVGEAGGRATISRTSAVRAADWGCPEASAANRAASAFRSAAVPAVVMGFVLLRIVFGAMIDATSHNLWPFELLMVGVPSLIWMAVVALVRRHRKIEGTV